MNKYHYLFIALAILSFISFQTANAQTIEGWETHYYSDKIEPSETIDKIVSNEYLPTNSMSFPAEDNTNDLNVEHINMTNNIIDSLALVEIYDSMGGTSWTTQTNWKTSNPISTWYGVSVNANGRVDSLSLGVNNLTNTIPTDINNLTDLKYLHFGNNNITGAIPNLSLPNLTYLSLFSNNISGSLQDYNLPQLKIMSISSNNLSGAIPNFSYLTNIEQIYLFGNQLTSIPDLSLSTLTLLRVSNNQLTGNIPDFLGLTAIVNLNLSDNQLSGTIPSSFNSLINLQYLQLYNNNLSGAIPDLSALSLVTFRVEENNLDGITGFNFSNPWGNISSNSGLQLQDNQFTFEDLEPHVSGTSNTSVSYSPQDSIGTDTTYTMQIGESLTINLGVDEFISSNIFYWYKDGILIDSVYGSSQYTISNIELNDAGVYTCQVKNFILTELILYSRPVTLSVSNPLIVTTTAEYGTGSLADAILFANNNAGPDTITFNIPGTAPFEISLNINGLPALFSDSTVINGISQPGYSEGDIRINGNNNFTNGIEIYGNYCEVYGLYIYHFTGAGLSISNANNIKIGANNGRNFFAGNTDGILVDGGNLIELHYNFSGTNASETTGIGNLNGIAVKNSQNVTIENNVCSANNGEGMTIENCDNITIKDNKVGVKQDGTTTFANLNGIVVKSASNNVNIEMNTIAFNTNYGIDIQDNSTAQINQNAIYCNTATPIAIGSSANSSVSTPTITTANNTTISGTATANSSIDLFINDNSVCGGTQPCQGKTYITTVSVDSWGNWSYTNTFTTGAQITATETVGTQTSGFANCMSVMGLCTVDLGNDTTICANEPVLLDAGNTGATYSWSDGSSNQTLSINPISTTHYFVTITDPAGCTAIDSINITVNSLPTLTMGNDTSVFDISPSFSLTASPTGGTWSGIGVVGSTFDPSISGIGTFHALYSYSDGTCTNQDSIQITVSAVNCTYTDSLALVDFYNATNGANWTNNTNWLSSNPISTWYGISINANGCVRALNLGSNNLAGTIPDLNLSSLDQIDFQDNQLTGSIPDFTYLTSLEKIVLTDNQISGSIPNFSNTPNLEEIWFNGNQFNGTLSDFSNIPNLKELWVNANNLNGSIPNFTNLPNLERFGADNNNFTGSVPNFTNTPALYEIWVNNNSLTGTLPDFASCPLLVTLFANSNSLTGTIPNYTQSGIRLLFLHDNQFTGTVPTFSNLTVLEQMDLESNQLTGSVPNFISSSLRVLHLNNNQFTDIPTFTNTTALEYFGAEGNNLTSISDFSNQPNLIELKIHLNELTFEDILPNVGLASTTEVYTPQDSVGTAQSVAISIGDTYTLDLGFDAGVTSSTYVWYKDGALLTTTTTNQLTINNAQFTDAGQYHVQITNSVATALTLNTRPITLTVNSTCISSDSLTLVDLYNTTNGASWTNNTNWLSTNPISTWYGVSVNPTTGCVDSLNLSNNNLVGTLSDFNLGSIITLNLDSNQITGTIPNFMNMPNLELLALGYNNLNGTIPDFGFLFNLRILRLDNNSLSGTIPNLSLGSLKTILLNNNNLSAIQLMPNLGSVEYLNVSNNSLSGTIPNFINSTLQYLFLNNNQFTGTAPDLAACTNLKQLALQHNQLSTIPNFSLPNLERLFIGYNQLADLPIFTNLPNLQVWDAANNQLTFEDINPNIAIASTAFVYNPQDSIGTTQSATVTSSTYYTISHLNIDNSISTNTYYWYLNGVLIDSTNFNQYTITNISAANAGTYHAQVVNPTAPDLRLYSRGFTITTIAPMLTSCRGTLNLNTDIGSCTAQADWSSSTPMAADAAGNDILPSFQSHVSNSTFNTGTTPVIYIFGNAPDTVSCTFNVVVTDNEAPSITCPSTLALNTDTGVCYTIFTGATPSVSDNCGIQSLTSSHNAGDTLYTGTTNIEYIATDSSGNADTCYLVITVTDNEDPIITNCPSDTTIFTDAGQCEAIYNWTAPTASDNCGVTNFTPSHTPGSIFNVGTTTVTYTASDANNNTVTCTFNITVIDNELPIFSNTPPDTISSCENIINWTPPTISDNCGTVTPTSTHNPGDVFPVGTTDVSYFAADVNGNQDTFTFKVIVHPSISLISSSTDISCFGANDGTATITPTNGTATFNYAWNNAVTTNTINNLSVGTYTVTVTDANNCIDSATIMINEPTAISSTVTKNNDVLCNGGTTGSATASATGGAGGFSYLWDNNSIGTQVTNLDAGRHYVTITDGAGCSVIDSIDINEPTIISATPTAIAPVQCAGQSNGSASVNATGGTAPYTYLWDNNETTDTATALNAGVHSVSVTDANNCLEVFTINIPATPPLQVTQSVVIFNVSCNGNNDGVGTFDVTGGTAPYSFVWSNSETTDTAYSLAAGAHQVTITDANGCVVGGSLLISEPTILSATLTIDSLLNCNGNTNGQLTATATGGTAPYNYQWNTTPIQTNATISNLGVGTYTITVTDDNDCEFVDSVTLVEPPIITVNTTFTDDSCGRGTGSISLMTNGGITPYNYTWGGTLTGETAAAVGGLNGGTYPITITDANDCVFTNSYFINNVCDSCSLFEPLAFSDNTPYTYNCLGNGEAEVIISMQGGKPEYAANNGSISNYRFSLTGATDLADGDYFDPNGIFSFKVKTDSIWTLSVDDDLGCGPVTTSGVFSESVGNCPNYCNLYPIQTMTTPADGDTIVLIDNDAPISVQVTNMDSLQNYTYSWSPSVRLSCSNCPNPIASPYESTRFDVVTQNDSGCVQIDTVLVQVAITPDSEEFVTVYSGITTNGDGNNDVLFIDGLELFPENELIVFNRWGNIVYQASPYNNDWTGKYQGKFLPEGAYYYILRTSLGNAKTLKGSILIIR